VIAAGSWSVNRVEVDRANPAGESRAMLRKRQRTWLSHNFTVLGFVGLMRLADGVRAGDLPMPVGWWPGDTSTVNLAGTNSAVLGNGGYTAAVFGKGFRFDGRNSVVAVPDDLAQHSPQITVACWVKFNELLTPGAATPGLQYLMFKRRPANSGFEGFALVKDRLTGADRFKIVLANGPGTANQVVTPGMTVVETNRFYFVAATADGSQVRLYVDGVLEGTSPAAFPVQCGSRPMFFGSSEESYNGRFSGVLDEPQLFDRALSQVEIQTLCAQSSVAPQLAIARGSGAVRLTWPSLFTDWTLETSSDLQAWDPLSPETERIGYGLSANFPADLPTGLFRLVKP
jgi:hypothetical protein